MAHRNVIKPESLVVGYALSRLDKRLLNAMGWKTWGIAYSSASKALREKKSSVRLLRDEFDPFFDNGRQGWWKRPPHPTRIAVLREFDMMTDAALIDTVRRILSRDTAPLKEVFDSLCRPATRVANVAERLYTGRLAEEFFLSSCASIIGFEPREICDMRQSALGYDFGVKPRPELAIEVKGMKKRRGDVLFTDREWSEALARRANYWLVVVACLPDSPTAKLFANPSRKLSPERRIVQVERQEWCARVAL